MKKAATKIEPQVIAETELQRQDKILTLARLRLEMAETRWEEAKEQARQARRKRKEAKTIARQAKKEAKRAKSELAEARSVLVEVEARLGPAVVPEAKARKGGPDSSATPAVSVPVEPQTPGLDPETEASTASAQESTVEKVPEAGSHGTFGNWR